MTLTRPDADGNAKRLAIGSHVCQKKKRQPRRLAPTRQRQTGRRLYIGQSRGPFLCNADPRSLLSSARKSQLNTTHRSPRAGTAAPGDPTPPRLSLLLARIKSNEAATNIWAAASDGTGTTTMAHDLCDDLELVADCGYDDYLDDFHFHDGFPSPTTPSASGGASGLQVTPVVRSPLFRYGSCQVCLSN